MELLWTLPGPFLEVPEKVQQLERVWTLQFFVHKRSRKGPPIGIFDFFSGHFLDSGGARIISARSRFRYYFL